MWEVEGGEEKRKKRAEDGSGRLVETVTIILCFAHPSSADFLALTITEKIFRSNDRLDKNEPKVNTVYGKSACYVCGTHYEDDTPSPHPCPCSAPLLVK